jgi:CheY-like chemotaxis protein
VHLKQRVVICDRTGLLGPLFARCADETELTAVRDLVEAKQQLRKAPAHALILNAPSREALWALLEQARAQIPDTPLVGCCCSSGIEDVLARQVAGYLIKPVTRASLQNAIQAIGKPIGRMLLVEDDPDALELLKLSVQSLDGPLAAETAASGDEALRLLRGGRPDLMLLDIVLPDMSGWDVLAAKDQEDGIRDIPVIVVSAQDILARPATADLVVAAMGQGLSVTKLWACARALAAILTQPG